MLVSRERRESLREEECLKCLILLWDGRRREMMGGEGRGEERRRGQRGSSSFAVGRTKKSRRVAGEEDGQRCSDDDSVGRLIVNVDERQS